uniref:Uncharacterized protein n=1 Tax=Arundo donax TaxID=35708 RepID=A0A0A9HH47_ARUDO
MNIEPKRAPRFIPNRDITT